MNVSNWDKWQTYRSDRSTPPWIKVYRNLLSNPEWAVLTDSEKGQLLSIWILAADKNGTIPDDPRLIQKMCMLDSEPDINRFAALGFLSAPCQPSGNQAVTDCPQLDAPDKTRLDKTRVDKKEIGKNSRFIPPSQNEVLDYMISKNFNHPEEAERFVNFYESNGWKVGKNKMKKWQSAVGGWIGRSDVKNKEPTMRDKILDESWADDITDNGFGGLTLEHKN